MSFMHFDAHTAAAGVIIPILDGTEESPQTAFGIGTTTDSIESGWVFVTNTYYQAGPPLVNYIPGNITKVEWDFGIPNYSNRPPEVWYENKSYTETFWLKATQSGLAAPGEAPATGYNLDEWYDISLGNHPAGGPFWYWAADAVGTVTGMIKVEIARDNLGTPGTVVATGYYSGNCRMTASGGGGDGGCFTAGSLVLMAAGNEKPIEDVKEGEMVVSLTDNDDLVAAKVSKVMAPRICNVYEVKLSNGKVIETTAEHPFRTVTGKWLNIDPEATYQPTLGGRNVKPIVDGKLHCGTRLYGFETNVEVVKIKNTGRQETVYNLSKVDGHHNFFVEGICVHNVLDEGRTVKE